MLLLVALLLAEPEKPLYNDRPAILKTYEDGDPEYWGIKDWDHEA